MISFIMPAKNAGKYIDQAIEGLTGNRTGEWELVVVEDHSEDDTLERLSAWSEKDGRIRVFVNPGEGKIAGLNHGYSRARGEIIKCIDADDILDGAYFEEESLHGCDAMCHDAAIVSSELVPLCDYTVNPKILSGSFERCLSELVSIPRCVWSFNRRLADRIFPMPEALPFEDVWFSLVIKRYAADICHVPRKLYAYRQHESQTYAGILNFEEKAVVFRAVRVLRLLEVLGRNLERLSLEGSTDDRLLERPRTFYSLLGQEEQPGILEIMSSPISPGMKARVILSRRLGFLAPWALKLKWRLQR